MLAVAASSLFTQSSCSFGYVKPEDTTPSYVALEVYSGRVLYSSNANIRRPIGMLTNVATAVVVLDWVRAQNVDLNQMVTVPATAVRWPRTNLLKLRAGESLTLRDALYTALLCDDSAAASTAAHACGISLNSRDPEGAFVAQMNHIARRLGMVSTVFKASNGAVITQSSARDMALLGMYALADPNMIAITSQQSAQVTVHSPLGMRGATLRNNNRLLPTSDKVDGLKVATSKSAGSCLMVSSRRASVKRTNPATGQPGTYGQRLLVVILGMPSSRDRYRIAHDFLVNGWAAWDSWLPTNDYKDKSKFIILPH